MKRANTYSLSNLVVLNHCSCEMRGARGAGVMPSVSSVTFLRRCCEPVAVGKVFEERLRGEWEIASDLDELSFRGRHIQASCPTWLNSGKRPRKLPSLECRPVWDYCRRIQLQNAKGSEKWYKRDSWKKTLYEFPSATNSWLKTSRMYSLTILMPEVKKKNQSINQGVNSIGSFLEVWRDNLFIPLPSLLFWALLGIPWLSEV